MANENDSYRLLITCGSAISFFITLRGLLALSSRYQGLTVNMRIISALFFIVLLVVHIVFSFTGISLAPYIIITGILLVLYRLVSYLFIQALSKN